MTTCICNRYIKRVIGVTRTFSWTITTNGEAQSLEGRDLTLLLIHPRGNAEELDFTTANNVVSFTWQGDDQKELGPYSIILYENYGIANQRRVDIHYFLDLIPWSEKESGSYSDLTEESIELESQEISGETVVVDNLTSTNPSFALSANMGRVLNEKILALLTPTEATGAQLDTFITEASEGWYLVALDSGGSMLVQVVMDGPVIYQVALTEPHSGRIMLRHYNTQVPNPAWTEWADAYVDKLTAQDIAFGHVSDSGMKITIGGVDHIVSQTSQPLGSSNAFVAPTWEALTIALATKQNTLIFDNTPTAGSNNPVTSQGIKSYVDSHSSGVTVDDALSTTSENPVQNKVVTVALNGKQATIDDLSTIRSGAASGATAYQKPGTGIPSTDLASAVQTDLGKAASALQPSALNGYYTKTQVDAAVEAKQDVIQTVNVSVDNSVGVPSGSASVSGNTMSFSFNNLKGATGAQGPQGEKGARGEQGAKGDTGVTAEASDLVVIHGIDNAAVYAATDVAGADALQTLNKKVLGGPDAFQYTTTATYLDVALADIDAKVGINILFYYSGAATLGSSFTQRIGNTNGTNQDIVSKGNNLYEAVWTNTQNPNTDTMRFWLSGGGGGTFVFYSAVKAGLSEKVASLEIGLSEETTARENLLDNVVSRAFVTKSVAGTSLVLTDHIAGLPLVSINQNAFIHNANVLSVDLFAPAYAQETTRSFVLKGYGSVLMTNANLMSVLKPDTKYTIAFDFEVLETPAGNVDTYTCGFLFGGGGRNTYTRAQFVQGFTGHISYTQTIAANYSSNLAFYTGGGVGENVDVRFTNVRIIEGETEYPWEEADNITFQVGDDMPVLVSQREWIEAQAEATIVYKTGNEVLESEIEALGVTIGKAFNKRTAEGTYITLTDHILGMPLVSLNQDAFIHNTNIISVDLFESQYGITTTSSFTLHGKAKYLITHANFIKVLRLHSYYYLSCDYEILSVDEVAETNRVGFSWGYVDLPASEFIVGKTGHISSSQAVTDQANLDTKSLVFYTGTNGANSLATVEFKNFRIVCGRSELPWEEAENHFFEVGDPMPVLNSAIEIIQPSAYAYVEYYVQSGESGGFVANQFVKCICHRGYSQLAPEDTEPAYVYAKKMGFLYGENDLWFTSDGVPVMVHARDLSIATDGSGNIDEVTYAYFKSLDFGQGLTYNNKYVGLKGLSFDEWILLMKTLGMTPFIDTKAIAPEPAGGDSVVLLKSILDKYNMTDKVVWAIGRTGAARLRTIIPKAKVGFTMTSTPTDQEIEDFAEFIVDNDPDSAFVFIDTAHLTTEVVEKCHAAGLGCYAWKADATIIDHPNEVVGYVQTGIDGLCSDGANLTKDVDNYYYDLYDVD